MIAVVFTLGCKVNSCESASLRNGLQKLGYEVYEDLRYADLYVINTCAVTSEAEKKSRQAVARVLKLNKVAKVIITGCASEKDALSFKNKKGVSVVTGTKNKDKILSLLSEDGVFIEKHDLSFDELLPPKTAKTRAYVKVQDGCNNFCSYCIIPYLRGRSRSRNPKSVVDEINSLQVNEVVLTAINLSSYDYNGVKLSGLIDMLSSVPKRIRLGSLEDNIVSDDFMLSLKKLKNFAPHFHLSLQSGSDAVLKKMNRHYTTSQFLNSVNLIRKYFPLASITTDVIVGFPTETEQDFIDTLTLCKNAKFADIHCFNYSKRDGTVASKMQDLPSVVKKERLNKLIALKQELKSQFIIENLNTIKQVVVEEFDNGYSVGYTENYIKTYIKGDYTDKIINVTLKSEYLDGVLAEIKE
ncbi:MAG: tRNA (N(6)-L-threonylcarbamoyladenosine(37)-C(2))-methylthiotransferase MtaB [Clostridia bacterium]|nr:tRNA (N(6)-L-threonylcarbamoyladenosine(37)-C(2))-methylthiotransferase MtaB [Clostridia bacterium]